VGVDEARNHGRAARIHHRVRITDSALVSAAMVAIGLARLWAGARLDAYRWFVRAALVAIFITRVFAFVESQFAAAIGLALDLVLLVAASSAAARERRAASRERVAAAS